MRMAISFIWVPPGLGGHSSPPYEGMRLQLRWSRRIVESLSSPRDAQCIDVSYEDHIGTATLVLADSMGEIERGEQLELVNGWRVLAVGALVEVLKS